MTRSENHLTVEGISKSFEQSAFSEKVLDNVTFDVTKGSIVSIIGKSGAGKSTLLRCLNGLEHPDSGKIYFEGTDTTSLKANELRTLRQKIGVVFQSFNLLSSRTVFKNVALPLELLRIPNAIQKEKVERILKLVGLFEKRDSYPSQLSGGQCQRVAIARALVVDATLLLCDEFTSALDPHTTVEILELLQELNKTLGITIVFVTHDINVVKEIAQKVCVLDQGQIVEKGPVEKIFINPSHKVTKELLSELLKDNLPDFIQHQLHPQGQENDDLVLKLIFNSQTSTKPVIAELIQQWNVPINIMSGNLDHIGRETFGHLVISLKHNLESSEKIIAFLKENHVDVHQLGYIRWA